MTDNPALQRDNVTKQPRRIVTSPDRLSCCVPGCRRTRRSDGKGDWICAQHWRAVPPLVKGVLFRARRVYRRRFGRNHFSAYPPGSPMRLASARAHHDWTDAWAAVKAAAIERAMGIG